MNESNEVLFSNKNVQNGLFEYKIEKVVYGLDVLLNK